MASHRSHRRSPSPAPLRGARRTAFSAAAAAAATLGAVVPTGPAAADPGEESADRSSAGARVDRLYADAERATEKYNAASERLTTLRRQVERAQDRAARGQAEVNRLRNALATVAGTQYRAAGLDPTLALLLSADPDSYLAQAAAHQRVGARTAGRLAELRRADRALRQHKEETADRLVRLASERTELARQKRSVQTRLAAARRLLHSLSAAERAERERADRSGGRPGEALPGAAAAGRAGGALGAAQGVLGRPYAWGQAGPAAFDCAGLTQWAYRQAGVAIPRTSQGQAGIGRRVPLSQARPGDLVIYRADASHVALYAGNGQVIHAPYPGAQVRYDPVNMMPVSAVTRP